MLNVGCIAMLAVTCAIIKPWNFPSEVTTDLAAKALSSRASGPDEAAISHSHFADPASAQCNTSATP